MSTCKTCSHWMIRACIVYDDGTEIDTHRDPEGHGHCTELNQRTAFDFGCNKFQLSDWDHIVRTQKEGLPWQHFVMADCPDCGGRGVGPDQVVEHYNGAGPCRRCMGTGKVRKYDDGFIGEERTRKHPKEVEKEELEGQEKRRLAAQAILDGLPAPVETKPVFEGRDVLVPVSKPNVL